MARYSGKGGSITNGGSNLAIEQWDVDGQCDTEEVTGMDSGGAKEHIATLTGWTASVSGWATGDISSWKEGTTLTAPVFKSSATAGAPKFTGVTAIVTGCKVNSSVKGAVKVDITLLGNGAGTWGVTP